MSDSRTTRVTCTTCPIGCRIDVEILDGKPAALTGNKCKRGEDYARAEVVDPKRVLTSTVRARGTLGKPRPLPVRTKSAIPKRNITDILKLLAQTEIELPVTRGQVILPNVCETGVDVIASRSME